MKCPMCESPDAEYQMFSGGTEGYCAVCDDNFLINDLPIEQRPRAALLQTEEGRIALRAQMDQELARLRDADV